MKWKLSRKGKILRNLALTLVCLYFIWAHYDYPLPTDTMNFRRAERQNLAAPSEVLFQVKGPDDRWALASGGSVDMVRSVILGRGKDHIALGVGFSSRDWDLYTYPRRGEGVEVIPSANSLVYAFDGQGNSGFQLPMFLLNVPEEAVRGEFLLDVEYRGKEYRLDAPLFDTEQGAWMAVLDNPETGWSDDWGCGGAYQLRLYDHRDELILDQRGTVPYAQ